MIVIYGLKLKINKDDLPEGGTLDSYLDICRQTQLNSFNICKYSEDEIIIGSILFSAEENGRISEDKIQSSLKKVEPTMLGLAKQRTIIKTYLPKSYKDLGNMMKYVDYYLIF
jgi:hypothetical protein